MPNGSTTFYTRVELIKMEISKGVRDHVGRPEGEQERVGISEE